MMGALAALGWFASEAVAAPLDTLSACAEHTSDDVSGLENLEAACPGLTEALQALGFDRTLPDDWRQHLDAHALRDLESLAERYTAPPPRVPGTASLAGILATLSKSEAPPSPSLWESFKAWFKHWLADSDSALARWLNRAVQQWNLHTEMSGTVLEIIGYLLGAAVVIAALIVILRELRAAGVLGRRRATAATAAAGPDSDLRADDDPSSGRPAGDALSALLRELVACLSETGRLPEERVLTHRELVARSRFETEAQRAAFARVAAGAEALFYGPKDVGAVTDPGLLAEGRSLLEELSRATAAS
jgi:hypothetical protein